MQMRGCELVPRRRLYQRCLLLQTCDAGGSDQAALAAECSACSDSRLPYALEHCSCSIRQSFSEYQTIHCFAIRKFRLQIGYFSRLYSGNPDLGDLRKVTFCCCCCGLRFWSEIFLHGLSTEISASGILFERRNLSDFPLNEKSAHGRKKKKSQQGNTQYICCG